MNSALLLNIHTRIEETLSLYLDSMTPVASKLSHAMRYAVMSPAKRLRPLLVYLTGHAFNAPLESLDAPACAIELIHTYSLIHDDLPAMDNADLRRGQPTCHIAFDESTAILAGDALQPLAFEILAQHPSSLSDQQRLKMIATLSRVSGREGMAAGQVLDLTGASSLEDVTKMYELKTGALFTAAIELGAIAANIEMHYLKTFAKNLGLAFQIQDDLLDIESHAQQTGKTTGIDYRNEKKTYPAFVGIETSRKKISQLLTEACDSLDFAKPQTRLLCDFAEQLIKRTC